MAGAAAAYMYMGKEAPARRKKVAAWMKKAEKDIVREAMKLKDSAFTEENFEKIVETVTKKYRQAQNLSPEAVGQFIAMITEGWQRAGKLGAATWGTGSTGSRRNTKARGRKKSKTAARA